MDKKKKLKWFRQKFAGKGMFKGKSFEVLGKSESTYLLSVRTTDKLRLHSFQIIDNDGSGIYPERESELQKLNPFRCNIFKNANQEYQSRNQIKIK